jgi:adenylate cyclase
MAQEIERKFLLKSDAWRSQVASSQRMSQGYLQRGADSAIRVRIAGERAWLNIKKSLDGIHRLEYEYAIPLADAVEMLEQVALRPIIDKTRHLVRIGRHTWEIDEFHADNAGLVVAEIELDHADEAFDRPEWLGEEVSTDTRYYNSSLSERPYNSW